MLLVLLAAAAATAVLAVLLLMLVLAALRLLLTAAGRAAGALISRDVLFTIVARPLLVLPAAAAHGCARGRRLACLCTCMYVEWLCCLLEEMEEGGREGASSIIRGWGVGR